MKLVNFKRNKENHFPRDFRNGFIVNGPTTKLKKFQNNQQMINQTSIILLNLIKNEANRFPRDFRNELRANEPTYSASEVISHLN